MPWTFSAPRSRVVFGKPASVAVALVASALRGAASSWSLSWAEVRGWGAVGAASSSASFALATAGSASSPVRVCVLAADFGVSLGAGPAAATAAWKVMIGEVDWPWVGAVDPGVLAAGLGLWACRALARSWLRLVVVGSGTGAGAGAGVGAGVWGWICVELGRAPVAVEAEGT